MSFLLSNTFRRVGGWKGVGAELPCYRKLRAKLLLAHNASAGHYLTPIRTSLTTIRLWLRISSDRG